MAKARTDRQWWLGVGGVVLGGAAVFVFQDLYQRVFPTTQPNAPASVSVTNNGADANTAIANNGSTINIGASAQEVERIVEQTAERVAHKYNIDRETVDRYADQLRSQNIPENQLPSALESAPKTAFTLTVD